MKTFDDWLRFSCLLSTITLLLCIHLTVSKKTSIDTQHNSPPCHRGILSLFHWCEQSDCTDKCVCRSSNVCKQICGQDQCNLLNCSTTQTCFQSVLLSEYTMGNPHVLTMLSYSPITQQDCSQGRCDLMKAMRYENQFTRTFQSCSEGNCGHLYSETDHTKQFCGNCKKMTCEGEHAKNCKQICVLGTCENMYCNAKNCDMVCAHEGTCNMTCGPNTENCQQTCSHGSTCTMNCSAKSCKQTCTEENSCTRNMLRTTQQTLPTTNATTLQPASSRIKTITADRIGSLDPRTGPYDRRTTLFKNVRTRSPTVLIIPSASVYISLSTNCLLLVLVSIYYLLC